MGTWRPARVVAGVLGLALALSGVACAHRTDAAAAPVPVAVDTDLGADDILALLYLLGRPDVDVVAVTVVGDGIVHGPAGGDNALALLSAAGRAGIPVAYGTAQPLSGTAAFPAAWRTQADGFYGMAGRWPVPSGVGAGDDPVALLAEQAVRYPGLRILALGPLTNVALALRRTEVVASRPQVVVSGGAVTERGNVPAVGGTAPVAEWNIGIDPVAADEVLRTGLANRWVPLDASNDVPVDVWFTRALAAQRRGPVGDLALAFLTVNAELARGGSYFWDPLAAVALTTPVVVTYQTATVAVRIAGAEVGRTAADPGGTPVEIATRADPVWFAVAMLAAYGPVGAPLPAYSPGAPDVQVVRELGAFRLDVPAALPAGDVTVGFDASSGAGYVVAIGRLAPGHAYADVEAAVAQGVTAVPPWFTIEALVEVPSGSRPTWLVNLPAGTHAVVAASQDGSGMRALGQLTTR